MQPGARSASRPSGHRIDQAWRLSATWAVISSGTRRRHSSSWQAASNWWNKPPAKAQVSKATMWGSETKAQGTSFPSPAVRHFHLVEKIQRGLVEFGLYRSELTDVLTARSHDLEQLPHFLATFQGVKEFLQRLLDPPADRRDLSASRKLPVLANSGGDICSRMAKNRSALLAKCQ